MSQNTLYEIITLNDIILYKYFISGGYKMNQILDIIKTSPYIYKYLKRCPYEILNKWEVVEYEKAKVVLKQGVVYNSFFIIVEGKVDIYIMSDNGKRYSQAIYSAGNFIGELEIFDQLPFICSVETLTPVKALKLDRKYFLEWINQDIYFCHHFMKYLSRQFYHLSEKAGKDALYPLKNRICEYLIHNIKHTKPAKLPIDKELLSRQMAVTPRSVNRILRELTRKNILEVKNNKIYVLKTEALKDELE